MAIVFHPITKTVQIGGREFTLSALPVGLVRTKLLPVSQGLAEGTLSPMEATGTILGLLQTSLSFAEPSITVEDLDAGLLMDDLMELFGELAQISGMSRKAAAEGEVKSPASPSGSTSSDS